MTAPARECQPEAAPVRQRLTPLENVLGVMKSARSKNNVMEVWADDLKAMEDAVAEVATLKSQVEGLTKALRSVSAQCGNVIYNCEQRPADNDRHLGSWGSVKKFIDTALAMSLERSGGAT